MASKTSKAIAQREAYLKCYLSEIKSQFLNDNQDPTIVLGYLSKVSAVYSQMPTENTVHYCIEQEFVKVMEMICKQNVKCDVSKAFCCEIVFKSHTLILK